jgi:hypothetical protein
MKEILITKGDGTTEPFDPNKLQSSLRKSGASAAEAGEVSDAVLSVLKPGMTTKQIYAIAFKELKRISKKAASKFSLKAALFKLGPEGYPFETFIGAMLKGRGYATKLRQNLNGRCINHEIDVIAERQAMNGRPATRAAVECKFHNAMGTLCRIQTALYCWARFLDIRAASPDIDSMWLVTNTKFSIDAIQYSDCIGLKLLGWSFPRNESLQIRIEENRLYPITVLQSLDKSSFSLLDRAEILLVKEIAEKGEGGLIALGIPENRASRLVEESQELVK